MICRGKRYFILCVSLLAALLIAQGKSVAQGKASKESLAEAKVHFQAGKSHYEKEKYREAITEFQAGYDLVGKPAFLLNIGECYRALGDPAKARDHYKRYLTDDPNSSQREKVEKLVAELDAELAASTPSPESPPASKDPFGGARQPPPAKRDVFEAPPLPPPAQEEASAPPEAVTDTVVVTAKPATDEDDDSGKTKKRKSSTPFYGKVWFWTLIGLGVAGGIGAGVYFASKNDYVESGSIGTIKATP